MGLYERVKEVAKSKGYSINRLELELGFARSSISKFNKNTPSAEKIQQIADLLGVSVDYLLNGKEASEKEHSLTAKDEKDIEKILKQTEEQLLSQEGLMFDGKPPKKSTHLLQKMKRILKRFLNKRKNSFFPKKA